MRMGFTTGSCAAAAAKAATYMILSGMPKETISIITPKNIVFNAEILDIQYDYEKASCAVIKDGGDDPDVTTGLYVYADVVLDGSVVDKKEKSQDQINVIIDGGEGVGRVTKPGLDQPVGNAAINRVPRQMIEKEVREVLELFDFVGIAKVTIKVPNGDEVAKKTFNPNLGIIGGISILGTTGIVEPMSNQALIDTIKVCCNQKKALGNEILAVTPGNYGLEFMKNYYGYDLEQSVKCSNFIGDTIDIAIQCGFKKMLLTGHIGKLIKVAGGMMNTHSREGDCRMELMSAAAIRSGASSDIASEILDAVATEEGIRILKENNIDEKAMEYLVEKISFYIGKRCAGKLQVEVVVYANQYGLLGKTSNADEFIKYIRDNGVY